MKDSLLGKKSKNLYCNGITSKTLRNYNGNRLFEKLNTKSIWTIGRSDEKWA